MAAQAVDRLGPIPGAEARRVTGRAQGIRRAAFTQLDRHQEALAIDESLVADFANSGLFELRVCAGEALVHAIWTYGHLRDEAPAIGYAQRLAALFGQDTDPAHLVEIGELVLSGAEKLNHRRIWRRASPAVSDQVQKMCDAILALANRVGGDLGQAVALSARLTRDSALVQQHRLRTSFANRHERPPVDPSALPAVQIVEQKARETGSEERYLDLAMIRATTLAEAGRTDEALAALDELTASFNVRGRALKTAGPLAIKALRKTIASQT